MKMLLEIMAAAKIDPADVGIPTVNADNVLTGVLNTVYYAGGIACVIVIVIAGLFYVLSNGDASKVERAKNAILYAVVGLVIIMMAFIITGFIRGRL